MRRTVVAAAFFCLAAALPARAAEVARSGPSKVLLVEIFSSEGCSSCPPADEWLARFVGDRRLWHDYVPAVFHVDYWDKLGWKDVFASRDYTDRQRAYAQAWAANSVYTPGVVLDGNEWKEWWRAEAMPEPGLGNAGLLSLDALGHGLFQGTFLEGGAKGGVYRLHVALLGFGVKSEVKAGENAGRNLTHQFLVLDYGHSRMQLEPGDVLTGKVRLHSQVPSERRGIAAWVTREGWTDPVQAAGAYFS